MHTQPIYMHSLSVHHKVEIRTGLWWNKALPLGLRCLVSTVLLYLPFISQHEGELDIAAGTLTEQGESAKTVK